MHLIDYILIALIAAAVIGAVVWRRRHRANGCCGAGGCCGDCAGCAARCEQRGRPQKQ